MGSTNNKLNKQDSIEEDIKKLNLITNSQVFKNKIGIKMEFIVEVDTDLFSQIFINSEDVIVEIEKVK
jgi:hypothetical protein